MADRSAIEAYRTVIGSRIRSQLAYRASFWLNVATSVGIGLVEFIEIYAIFANVDIFGGLDLRQSALVFALANIGFALADTIFGQLDTIPTYLRLGRLEVLLVRPMPLLLQLVTSEVQLRRLGRLAVGMLIVVLVLPGARPQLHRRHALPAGGHPVRRSGHLWRLLRHGGWRAVLSHRRRRVHLGLRLRRQLRGTAPR